MLIKAKNNRQVELRKLRPEDYDRLCDYFQHLQYETTRRYGPHAFGKQDIAEIYGSTNLYKGYIAIDIESSCVIAYAIIRQGYIEHDSNRLQSYGLTLNHETDCTYAPSVADAWQSQGIGNSMFQFIRNELELTGTKRVILWGGVQADNDKAVNFYRKNGFVTLGKFEYHGSNYDMILEIE